MSSGKNKRTDSRNNSSRAGRFGFFLAVCAVAAYLVVFFRCPFEPLAAVFPDGVSRASVLRFCFDPGPLLALWFGEPPEFALSDRLAIFLYAASCLGAATGAGFVFLRIFRYETRLGFCECCAFSTVSGLGFFSVFLHGLSLCGAGDAVFAVRIVTGVFCCIGCCALFRRCASRYGERLVEKRNFSGKNDRVRSREKSLLFLPVIAVVPLSALYLLTFPLPPVEYDVVSYHFPGVKETFLSGYFGFRTDSVYTNMPFGAEMFLLWGMTLANDWYVGALVGKTLLGATAFLTALGLYGFCARFFSRTTGLFAAMIYVATPWVFYISATGLIDGVVGMYLFFAVYSVALSRTLFGVWHGAFLAGVFAGSAVACKYPALLFVFVPVLFWLIFRNMCAGPSRVRAGPAASPWIASGVIALSFTAAALPMCGSWFVKNGVFTGNPTYPLLYELFGDATGHWTPEKHRRWTRVHRPENHSLSSLLRSAERVLCTSDYHAPVLVPGVLLALIPILRKGKTRNTPRDGGATPPSGRPLVENGDAVLTPLVLHILFVLACWWFFTHRLDRFWIPVLPLCCVLAARGILLRRDFCCMATACAVLLVAIAYATLVAAFPGPGKYNRLFLSQASARTDPVRVMPWTRHFNAHRPAGTLLLVGEAKAFDFECPVIFSSCFDDTVLEEIVLGTRTHAEDARRAGSEKGVHDESAAPETIRQRFHARGITDVFVDWNEIARFRSPGNYGFPEFVRPEVFERLVRSGVLREHDPRAAGDGRSGRAYRVVPPENP